MEYVALSKPTLKRNASMLTGVDLGSGTDEKRAKVSTTESETETKSQCRHIPKAFQH